MKKPELVVASRTPDTVAIKVSDMDAHEQDALARVLIHSITEAFKNPKVAADYERWKTARYGKPAG